MMERDAVVQRLRATGVIPVVRATSAEEALRLSAAIIGGGLTVLEITLTVPGAMQVLEQLRRRDPGLLLGVGSVLDAKSARSALAAGAEFIVTPALAPDVVKLCRKENVAVLPGALTPTEVVEAWKLGADFVKVFPAGALGGPAYVKSLRGPLPQVELVPTGGVSLANVAEYLQAGAAAVGVGSDLADVEAIRRGRGDKVTDLARAYLAAVAKARSA